MAVVDDERSSYRGFVPMPRASVPTPRASCLSAPQTLMMWAVSMRPVSCWMATSHPSPEPIDRVPR